MADEPVTFVVERNLGWHEVAGVYYGKLPARLTCKGSALTVFAWRLDKLPNGAALQQMPIGDLYEQFVRMRAENKLPPSNLADPPRKSDGGQKGSERGPETWWTPTPLPRGQDWTPEPVAASDETTKNYVGFDEPGAEPEMQREKNRQWAKEAVDLYAAVLLFPAAE